MESLSEVFVVERSEDSGGVYKYCEGVFSTLEKAKASCFGFEWRDWSMPNKIGGSSSIPKNGIRIQIRLMKVDRHG